MSLLRIPGLGPIVGHTTAESCRIWIRGSECSDNAGHHSENRRTIGLITVEKINGKVAPKKYHSVFAFRFHRKYDRTGTFNLGLEKSLSGTSPVKLASNTSYVVRVGTLTVDDSYSSDLNISDDEVALSLPNIQNLRNHLIDLPRDKSSAEFQTFSSDSEKSLRFLLGSSRYPGMQSKLKASDEIFRPMLEEVRGRGVRTQARFVLMVGDQIYADKLGRHFPFEKADTFKEFQERYLTAFGTTNMAALLRSVPTYMILDDHEIEDNWSRDRLQKPPGRRDEARETFNLAIAAYCSYQWVHGPRFFPDRWYLEFTCNGYPFFVLDTRTQRSMEDSPKNLKDNRLLGRERHIENEDGEGEPSQIERLEYWLKSKQEEFGNAPKFIASSSVFVPNSMDARAGRLDGNPKVEEYRGRMIRWMEASDSWPAFPETRHRILRCIIDNGI